MVIIPYFFSIDNSRRNDTLKYKATVVTVHSNLQFTYHMYLTSL